MPCSLRRSHDAGLRPHAAARPQPGGDVRVRAQRRHGRRGRARLDFFGAAAPAVILGAITGIGGGILRDILVRQIPVVLREGLYAIPALIGAAIVVGAARAGAHGPAAPIIGAAICFVIRLAGLTLGLNLPPRPAHQR
jgi:uncharacterized membrane protein YeiH